MLIENNNTNLKFKRLVLPDKFIEHGDLVNLRNKYGLTKDLIKKEILKLIGL